MTTRCSRLPTPSLTPSLLLGRDRVHQRNRPTRHDRLIRTHLAQGAICRLASEPGTRARRGRLTEGSHRRVRSSDDTERSCGRAGNTLTFLFTRERQRVTRVPADRPAVGLQTGTLALMGSGVATMKSACLALAALSMLTSCAYLRLSGCARLAQCGDLAAYSCEGELVCADDAGQTVNAEPLTDSHLPCRICPSRPRPCIPAT